MGKQIIGSGQYSVRTYQKAAKTGSAIKTSRGTAGKARKMHRDNLLDWVEDEKAVNEDKRIVTDPRKLVPYRGRCYGAIVEALLSLLPAKQVKSLKGTFTKDFSRITGWAGQKNAEIDGVVATRWVSGERLFEIACKIDPELKGRLRKRQSTRPGVSKDNRIRNPLEKFINNVGVIQRTGGVTPYALPLMRSLFAIDHRYVDRKGEPQIEFRLVIGRSEPQKSGLRAYNAEQGEEAA